MNNMNYKLKKNKIDSKMINPTWLKSMLAILLALQMVNLTPFVLAANRLDENKAVDKIISSKSGVAVNPVLQLPSDALVARHSPNLNGSRLEGAARVLLGESFSINSNAVVTGNIYVPGTPNININGGNSTYRGTIVGTGNTTPSGYSINLNSNTTVNHIVTRTDAIEISNVPSVPQPQGNRDVSLNRAQSPGDFATIRNLTLNANYGLLSIPAGTYGQFIANSGTGFILGVENQSTVYNLQGLTLNSNSELQVRGNVTINIQNTVNLSSNVKAGNIASPISLAINIANGGMNLNSNVELYGVVRAPLGTVNLNSNSTLIGLLVCDRVSLNSNSLLRGLTVDTTPATVTITQPTPNQTITTATTTVTGTFSDESVVTSVKVNNVTATINGSNYTATIPLTLGSNTITVNATDIFGNVGTSTVTVTRTDGSNQPPQVNAGVDQSITLPTNNTTLNGVVTDDGNPNPPATLTITWSKVSSPTGGTVTFGTPNAAITTATFNVAGTYVLKLEASDSALSASDLITITVNQAQQQNQAPVVNAGNDLTITLPNNATLNGTVTDDGLPQNATLSISWMKVSGSGTVTFTSPNTAVTTASFSQAGTYILRLMASDTELNAVDDVTVIVNPAQPNNQAPTVNAGQDQTITLPNSATLQGQASDDGNPNPPAQLTLTWTKQDGPGNVTFSSPNTAITQASFSIAGTYTLRLTASDSSLSTSDDLVVIANGAANQPPTVSAGDNQIVVLPAVITLTGTASDDGLPVGSSLTVTWSKVTGPGNVSFDKINELTTDVFLEVPGTYVFRLTATDGTLSSSSDTQMLVKVIPRLMIYSNQDGFDPDEFTTQAGDKLIMIRNRTGQSVTYVFTQGSQTINVVSPARSDVFIDATLTAGTATITAQGHSDWTCLITVLP